MFQVLCHHSVCLVLFHEKYGYNKIEKEFEKFAQLVAEQPNILVAEVGTTGKKYVLGVTHNLYFFNS